ncbi:hypothetical protein [Rubritalea tangerina]
MLLSHLTFNLTQSITHEQTTPRIHFAQHGLIHAHSSPYCRHGILRR